MSASTSHGHGRGCRESGTVTAELAVGLVSVVLVLGAVLGAARAAQVQLACADAARAGAREVARGEDGGRVTDVVRRLAGPTARVHVRPDGELVHVLVTVPVRVPLPGDPVLTARADAVAVPETVGPVLP